MDGGVWMILEKRFVTGIYLSNVDLNGKLNRNSRKLRICRLFENYYVKVYGVVLFLFTTCIDNYILEFTLTFALKFFWKCKKVLFRYCLARNSN